MLEKAQSLVLRFFTIIRLVSFKQNCIRLMGPDPSFLQFIEPQHVVILSRVNISLPLHSRRTGKNKSGAVTAHQYQRRSHNLAGEHITSNTGCRQKYHRLVEIVDGAGVIPVSAAPVVQPCGFRTNRQMVAEYRGILRLPESGLLAAIVRDPGCLFQGISRCGKNTTL